MPGRVVDPLLAHNSGYRSLCGGFCPTLAGNRFWLGDLLVPVREATWERGRGWALDLGLRCAANSADNPLLGQVGTYTISQILNG